ncbi:helix-turn-helix domain-containing protein [Jeotgalibaca sp. A122]|uniref:helix-turn-helix domain-containing protein n=1 Tax=Jeotgalibaca sp. A122 TaxID=3457322 RepID=UPI003FD5FC9C
MWRLISTKDQRKYRIIENLYAADRPLTISELAKSIGSSARIIKYDLAEINETLKELAGAIVSSSEGVFLNLPSSVGLDYFQRKLYRISPSFLFLEKVFFDETMGYAEMKDYLYISDSSLRRLVQNVKLALQDYGLSLETQPFRVVGHEGLIRNFYTAYFSEKYTMED